MKPTLPAELLSLIERYSNLARLLPAEEDFDLDDVVAVAEARLVLQEMTLTKSAIDALLRRPSR